MLSRVSGLSLPVHFNCSGITVFRFWFQAAGSISQICFLLFLRVPASCFSAEMIIEILTVDGNIIATPGANQDA